MCIYIYVHINKYVEGCTAGGVAPTSTPVSTSALVSICGFDLRFRFAVSGFDLRFRVWFRFAVSNFGFRIAGLGLRVLRCGVF